MAGSATSQTTLVFLFLKSLAADGFSVAIYATFFPYLALLALGIHIFLLWGQYKRLHAERLPNEPLRGLLMYMVNRIISLRRLRMPAPTVKPGDEI